MGKLPYLFVSGLFCSVVERNKWFYTFKKKRIVAYSGQMLEYDENKLCVKRYKTDRPGKEKD